MLTTGFWTAGALVAVISYLLGSVTFGVIVSRLYARDDVRLHGSGNAGATNMLRTYGKWPAALTITGDFLKAIIAVIISRNLFSYFTKGGVNDSSAGYIAGLFVMLGHLFPIYFRFKGGKGVATTLGVTLAVNPLIFLILSLVFIPLIFITKMVSLSSVLGAVAYPVLTLVLSIIQTGRPAVFDTICALITGAVVIFVHRSNIKRILSGTENKIGQKKSK